MIRHPYLIFILFISGISSLFAQSSVKRLSVRQMHIAAHRGVHNEYPENSIASIEEAIRLGVSIVELDVRSTKDSVLVLMHDKTIDRTTFGKGEISAYTYQELSQIPLRASSHASKPSDQKTITFAEALRYTKGKIVIDIDFKESDPKLMKKAIDIIVQENAEDHVLFFLYDVELLRDVSEMNKNITIMPRAKTMMDIEKILATGLTRFIHVDESFVDTDYLSKLKKNGVMLWINTLGDWDNQAFAQGSQVYQQFLKKYPYAAIIQTDYPQLMLEGLQ